MYLYSNYTGTSSLLTRTTVGYLEDSYPGGMRGRSSMVLPARKKGHERVGTLLNNPSICLCQGSGFGQPYQVDVSLSPQLKGCDCLAKPWTWLCIGAAGFAQPTVEGMRLFG